MRKAHRRSKFLFFSHSVAYYTVLKYLLLSLSVLLILVNLIFSSAVYFRSFHVIASEAVVDHKVLNQTFPLVKIR